VGVVEAEGKTVAAPGRRQQTATKNGGVDATRRSDQKGTGRELRGVRLRPAERGRFLRSLAAGNTARKAAADTGRNLSTFYRYREREARFRDAWLEAEKQGTQALEQVAISRAKDQSDTLLMFLLKRRDPAYRDSHKVEVNHGGTVQHEHKVVSLAAVVSLADEIGVLDQLGLGDRLREGVPAAREILPAPSE
jgi:hypothetical protein